MDDVRCDAFNDKPCAARGHLRHFCTGPVATDVVILSDVRRGGALPLGGDRPDVDETLHNDPPNPALDSLQTAALHPLSLRSDLCGLPAPHDHEASHDHEIKFLDWSFWRTHL